MKGRKGRVEFEKAFSFFVHYILDGLERRERDTAKGSHFGGIGEKRKGILDFWMDWRKGVAKVISKLKTNCGPKNP